MEGFGVCGEGTECWAWQTSTGHPEPHPRERGRTEAGTGEMLPAAFTPDSLSPRIVTDIFTNSREGQVDPHFNVLIKSISSAGTIP